jgi:hypothetical protein
MVLEKLAGGPEHREGGGAFPALVLLMGKRGTRSQGWKTGHLS